VTPVMRNDLPFQKDVEVRVKESYPLLGALANGPILLLASKETNISQQAAADIARCFAANNTLKPLSECMALSRAELFAAARSRLPIWETMPVLRHLVAFFRRLLSGKPRKTVEDAPTRSAKPPRAGASPEGESPKPPAALPGARAGAAGSPVSREREALVRYTKAIKALREHFVQPGTSVEATLDELSNKWNPLYAEEQKRDLVEDVNALVRDYLRPVRRTFMVAPPDLERIRALAEQLADAKSLSQIKKREPLRRYIELYMVKCLEPKKTR
jgi:hypothetical protein